MLATRRRQYWRGTPLSLMAETMVVSRPPAQIVATGSAATNGAQRLSTPERLITAYFTAIPLLWLLGLLLPSALLLVFGILVVYVRSRRAVLIAIPWALVALSQVISVLTNMVAQSQPAIMFLKHLLSSYVLGWIVLAAAICIGASGMIRPQVFSHAVARIGFAYVILAIPAYIIAFTSSAPFLFFLSPAGYLVPATMNARNFSFGIFVYKWEDFLGTFMPRLGLFFPWSTAGGYAGLFLVLILLNEPNARRRRLGVSAGVFMVFASMSRLAIVALAACVTLRCFFALSRRMQVVLAVLIVSLMVALAAVVESPTALISQLNAEFEAARPGSNEARDLIYAMTWDAIREAPLLGHGWPGESTMAPDNSIFGEDAPFMVIGSHSTISGLIYK